MRGGEEGLYVERVAPSATSARSVDTIVPSYSQMHPSTVNGHPHYPPPDDKQDLERQRLMAEASAPPADDNEDVAGPSAPINAPSAPTLAEEDEYNAHTFNHDHDEAGDNLPRYRR
jgi:arrestin-related trafficking adapter 9